MELMTSWERKGLEQGRREGMEHVVLRLLRERLGEIPALLEQRIDGLSTDQLDALSDVLLKLKTRADLEKWLAHNVQ